MDQRVQHILTDMTADPRRGLSLASMAQSVNLSTSHMCYLFKTETGTPAAHYLKLLKMHDAAMLLSSKFLSVKQVMVAVGFKFGSHFVRDFKKIYGQTPTEYQRSATDGNGRVSVPRALATGPTERPKTKAQSPKPKGQRPRIRRSANK